MVIPEWLLQVCVDISSVCVQEQNPNHRDSLGVVVGLYQHLYHRWTDKKRAAIVFENENYSYATLDHNVRIICTYIKGEGIERGSVIAVQLPKSLLLLEVLLAGLALGCPVLPLNNRYTPSEAEFYLRDAHASLFIGSYDPKIEGMKSIVDHKALYEEEPLSVLPNIEEDELAILLYTSGTTGVPKGAMITHANVHATVHGLHTAWDFTQEDRLLHMLPLFHVHGLFVAQFVALYAHCTSIWMSSFLKEECLFLLSSAEITVMMAVPTIYYRLLDTPERYHFPQLRLCTSGSAPLPVPMHIRFQEQFGMSIVERYGMTEVGIVLSNPYDGARKVGTVGLPVSGASLRVVDPKRNEDCEVNEVGELWISGPSVISGYLRRPEQTEKTFVGSWLRSGDLAAKDEDGYIRIAGRSKDLVISGGFNIYPIEVEAVFLTHPFVMQAAGVGIPDLEWGECFVMLIIGAEGLDEVELQRFAREKLVSYKRPKRYIFVDSFPRNAMGKVQKAKIRIQLKKDF
jgi:malonyl-CoA/methylmalonyl-CoA synthetase